MSGVGAVVHWSGAPDPARVDRLVELLGPLGPDGVDVRRLGSVVLAHARFATTPEAWHDGQPLRHRTHDWWLTADARLDNLDELRAQLAGTDHARNADGDVAAEHARASGDGLATDADVLLAAYERWGDGLAAHLVGDFAVVVWDAERRRLVLVRDHLGVRQLFWARGAGGEVVVASTVRAAVEASGLPPDPDPVFLASAAMFQGSAPGRSVFAGVRAVPPATVTVVDEHADRSRPYWTGVVPFREATREEAAAAVRRLVEQAVRARTRGLERVACELSGGWDSTSIYALAARTLGAERVLGLSAVFPGLDCDESTWIDAAERHVGAPVVRIDAPAQPPYDFVAEVAHTWDLPTLPDSAWFMPMLAAAAGDGRRVVLTGQGGDHALMGMFGHAAADALDRWRPSHAWRAHRAEGMDPWPAARATATSLARRVLRPTPLGRLVRRIRSARRTYDDADRRFLGPALRAALTPLPGTPDLPGRAAWSRGGRRSGYDEMLTQFLEVIDRSGRVAGVEVRHPLLDVRLIEYVLSLDAGLFLSSGQDRALHEASLRDVLPRVLRDRVTKAEFGGPSVKRALEVFTQVTGPAVADGGDLDTLVDRLAVAEVAHADGLSAETNDRMWEWWGAMATWVWRATVPRV